jgi:hypothetical protein
METPVRSAPNGSDCFDVTFQDPDDVLGLKVVNANSSIAASDRQVMASVEPERVETNDEGGSV